MAWASLRARSNCPEPFHHDVLVAVNACRAPATLRVIVAEPTLRAAVERSLRGRLSCSLIVTSDPARVVALRNSSPATPVVVVALRRAQVATALDAGADAALSGAFRPAELRARVRALARRTQPLAALGPLSLDPAAGTVELDGARLELPPRELALLCCLAATPGCVLTKDELLARCWHGDSAARQSRTLERNVARLRRRLGRHAPMLVTVWGVGYRLDAPF
jgi:DNA-binding response OmpR family regulator